jgi:DNA-binding transcriptional MerR regulator
MMSLFSEMTIGALALETRCSVPTIRYYEEIGLLPKARRGAGGHRVYGDADLRRLTFIRRCRDFGFPIEQIRELAALVGSPNRDCTAARDLAGLQLTEVRRKLGELRALERSLKTFVNDCNAQCAGGPASECVIPEDLVTPGQPSCCGSAEIQSSSRTSDDCISGKT